MDFLHHPDLDRIIAAALQEDVGEGDHTSLSTIPPGAHVHARCLIKGMGVVAGVALAEKILRYIDHTLEFEGLLSDGAKVQPGDEAFYVHGSAHSILMAERLVLNFMQRMSGIATATRQVVDIVSDLDCKILDTRKTTPLVRLIEKWAVAIGGGTNHRLGLYDMIMIKDNHIDFAGGIIPALQACRAYKAKQGLNIKVEIETRNLEEVQTVLDEGGVDFIMLDNMSLEDMRTAVKMIDGAAQTEASGGITMERIRPVAETGVDSISMGALTHTIRSMDISLKAVNR